MTILEKKKLGDILVESNVITPEQLKQALLIQKDSRERLGKILTKQGFATEEDIVSALGFQLGLPRLYLFRSTPDKKLLDRVPEDLVRRHEVFPVTVQNGKALVAMSDPLNLAAIQDLEFVLGMEIEQGIATGKEIEGAIQRYYGLPEALEGAFTVYNNTDSASFLFFDIDEDRNASSEEAPIIRAVNKILQQAIKEGASDVHIEPQENDLRVRMRVDGVLREVMTLSRNIFPPMVSRLKIMAGMDIAEKRMPQDGRIQIKNSLKTIDLRVSSLPAIFGEKIVLRLLDKDNQFLTLDQLGFRPGLSQQYKGLIKAPYGMLLLTGPTGSGKTTTLYASLNEINDAGSNIVTIEDPVEYVLPGIIQVQTNSKAGLDFAHGLRSILRQDPDIIMIGEIRDSETASIAVRAATTGHLVFSTLHTNDAAGALTRLVDMGVEPFLVASSVIGVVAQRLVRRICPYCREEYEVMPGDRERHYFQVPDEQRLVLKRGKGCAQCGFTGYLGRLAVHEIMTLTHEIRSLILKKATTESIRHQAMAEGMESLFVDGLVKVRNGLTTVSELLRVTLHENT